MTTATVLETTKRRDKMSKKELLQHRSNGEIPSRIYSKKIGSHSIFIQEAEFQKVLLSSGRVFEVNFNGQKQIVDAQLIQREPVTGKILHLNLHCLNREELTTTPIRLRLVGTAIGAKLGGIVMLARETIKVSAIPKNMPEHIDIDISHLDMGDTLHASEIKLPPGITLDTKSTSGQENDLAIATCVIPSTKEKESSVAADEVAPSRESGK